MAVRAPYRRIYRTVEVDADVDITEEVEEAVAEKLEEMKASSPCIGKPTIEIDYAIVRVLRAPNPKAIIAILLNTIGHDVLTRDTKRRLAELD